MLFLLFWRINSVLMKIQDLTIPFSLVSLFYFVLFCTRDGFSNMPSKMYRREVVPFCFPPTLRVSVSPLRSYTSNTNQDIHSTRQLWERAGRAHQHNPAHNRSPDSPFPLLQAGPTHSTWLWHFCPSYSPVPPVSQGSSLFLILTAYFRIVARF